MLLCEEECRQVAMSRTSKFTVDAGGRDGSGDLNIGHDARKASTAAQSREIPPLCQVDTGANACRCSILSSMRITENAIPGKAMVNAVDIGWSDKVCRVVIVYAQEQLAH